MRIQVSIQDVRADELGDVCEALGEVVVTHGSAGRFNVTGRWSNDGPKIGEAARWTGIQCETLHRYLERSASERVSPPCTAFTHASQGEHQT